MLNIVMYQPEIPQNTGNVMRTCAAFHARLHLIEPLGFYLDEAHLRRAGMDYRDQIELHVWHDWLSFVKENPGTYYFTTRYGKKSPDEFDYTKDDEIYYIFGRESTGIDKEILKEHLDHCVRIPMAGEARCLNVSNTAAICAYEVMKQKKYAGLSRHEVIKGEDFLETFRVDKDH